MTSRLSPTGRPEPVLLGAFVSAAIYLVSLFVTLPAGVEGASVTLVLAGSALWSRNRVKPVKV